MKSQQWEHALEEVKATFLNQRLRGFLDRKKYLEIVELLEVLETQR